MADERGAAKEVLTIEALKREAQQFATAQVSHDEPALFGVTDGKAIGTYLQRKFQSALSTDYEFEKGNVARGIDFPGLNVDMKTTSHRQPQSSCPYKSARQKIFGLGYSLLIFVYSKVDDDVSLTAKIHILHALYVDKERTADFQTTRGIREIVERDGNVDDLVSFIADRNLPVDGIEAEQIAQEILTTVPNQGFLTISNALQWRLQYRRIIEIAGATDGVIRLH